VYALKDNQVLDDTFVHISGGTFSGALNNRDDPAGPCYTAALR